MRFSPKILLSLLAITPVVVVSAPAPQDEYSTDLAAPVISEPAPMTTDPIIASSATVSASSGSGRGKSCTRGRGGRGRWGQGRPTGIPSDPAGAPAPSASEPASSVVVEEPPVESPPAEAPEPSTPVEEAPAPEPSPAEEAPAETSAVAEEVNLVATGQDRGPRQSGQAQTSAIASPSPSPSAVGGGGEGEGIPPPAETSAVMENTSGGGSGGAAEGFESEILNAHNVARAKFNAPPMTWDSNSASIAREHYTSTGCVMVHGKLGFGENLYGGAGTGQQAVDGWMSEEPNWTAGDDYKEGTGHFTQVVWKGSTKLGCARVECGNGKGIVACEYSPAGNMLGDFANNVGK